MIIPIQIKSHHLNNKTIQILLFGAYGIADMIDQRFSMLGPTAIGKELGKQFAISDCLGYVIDWLLLLVWILESL